jgi:hypothetical protein
MKYKVVILTLIWGFLGTSTIEAQTFDKSRQEKKTFKVSEQTSIEIYNKYGNIHVFTWAKDSVKIEIDLMVRANKQSKVDKIYDYIDFEFSSSKYYVIARTLFRSNQSSFWSEVSDVANTVFSGNNKTQINYKVYVPASIDVKLENKFGNIYCTDHSGDFDVLLSNGDFKANELKGDCNLDLSFGNTSIAHIEKGKLTMNYGELELGDAKALDFITKSSTIKIAEIDLLTLESKRDKYFIGKVNSITGNTSFSYITINGFSRNIKMMSEYGEVKLSGIEFGFNLIELNTKYTDVYLNINKNFHADVSINYVESTVLNYPENMRNFKKETLGEKKDQFKITGFIGDPSKPSGKVDLTVWSGKLAIQNEIPSF